VSAAYATKNTWIRLDYWYFRSGCRKQQNSCSGFGLFNFE